MGGAAAPRRGGGGRRRRAILSAPISGAQFARRSISAAGELTGTPASYDARSSTAWDTASEPGRRHQHGDVGRADPSMSARRANSTDPFGSDGLTNVTKRRIESALPPQSQSSAGSSGVLCSRRAADSNRREKEGSGETRSPCSARRCASLVARGPLGASGRARGEVGLLPPAQRPQRRSGWMECQSPSRPHSTLQRAGAKIIGISQQERVLVGLNLIPPPECLEAVLCSPLA